MNQFTSWFTHSTYVCIRVDTFILLTNNNIILIILQQLFLYRNSDYIEYSYNYLLSLQDLCLWIPSTEGWPVVDGGRKDEQFLSTLMRWVASISSPTQTQAWNKSAEGTSLHWIEQVSSLYGIHWMGCFSTFCIYYWSGGKRMTATLHSSRISHLKTSR